MKINKIGLRGLARVVVVAAAAIVAACSSESSLSPNGRSTVPAVLGGASDTAHAISAVSEIAIPEVDGLVNLGTCDSLRVPVGNVLMNRAFGRGVQIYRWSGTAWTFVAPSAKLYPNAQAHGVIGTHYAGPTWEANDGGKVVAAVQKKCPADPKSIPWLLLGAVSNQGPGQMARVTYIQRLNTVGGNAPAEAGKTVGQEVNIPYTADYLFYRAR